MDKMIIAGYGLFLLVGAFFGWKAGSKISLIMGTVSAALVFLGLYMAGTNARNGFLLLLVVSVVLCVSFAQRYLATHKIMPSGMLLAVTLAFLVFCLIRFLNLK